MPAATGPLNKLATVKEDYTLGPYRGRLWVYPTAAVDRLIIESNDVDPSRLCKGAKYLLVVE